MAINLINMPFSLSIAQMSRTQSHEQYALLRAEHSLHLQYLDCSVEPASLCILREIGVSIAAVDVQSTTAIQQIAIADDTELLVEHTSSKDSSITYSAMQGRVFLDIRDGGDAWIRCLLTPGVQLTLTGDVSRRFVLDRLYDSQLLPPVLLYEQVSNGSRTLAPRFAKQSDALEIVTYHTYRELICELCRQFYGAGWVTGTGGSISIRYGNRIYMTPSGVPKERIQPDELYMLDLDGAILSAPQQKPNKPNVPKLSDCSPLFLHAYRLRNAGAVLHSHGFACNLITAICDDESEFRITHQEMIKGLAGFGYNDELVIPIIENTARESELADSLASAMEKYPNAWAVLVRRHGIYVWGDSWEAAKRHGECLHYLFEAAIEMHRLKLDYKSAPLGAAFSRRKRLRTSEDESKIKSLGAQHKYVILDIEGTTTPITFVHEVLFPFAKNNTKAFLTETWDQPVTQADLQALISQSSEDQTNGLSDAPTIAAVDATGANRDQVIQDAVAYVHWNISKDRKIGALKQLQGHVWDLGYKSGELKALVYPDVPRFLERMRDTGATKVGIYSSGSRQAQRLLFQYSDQGDLRDWLSVYFDTKIGHKREANSYIEILLSLGVDSGSDVLFVTDVIQEAEAAAQAGLDTVLSVRPGNVALPAEHPFRTIRSFDEL